jgi:hypothetical protein
MGVPTPIAGRLGWATLPSGRVAGLDAGLLVSAPTEENAGAPGTFKTVTDLRDAELTEAGGDTRDRRVGRTDHDRIGHRPRRDALRGVSTLDAIVGRDGADK